MAERILKPASAKTDTNWKIDGSEISTREERNVGLAKEGNSEEVENILLSQGFNKESDGTMTMKVQSNTVKRNEKGNVVERRDGEDGKGKILTSTEKENSRD